MAIHPSGPVQEPERIVSLDLIRGVAVLGILLMNAVSFRWDEGLAPLFNLNAVPQHTWHDSMCARLHEPHHHLEQQHR